MRPFPPPQTSSSAPTLFDAPQDRGALEGQERPARARWRRYPARRGGEFRVSLVPGSSAGYLQPPLRASPSPTGVDDS
jgi:hypothetical protein